MSKYNNIKSIPVDSIPKRKIKKAIHEWAEGNDFLEQLLTICYEKDIKTSGCHAGPGPYIDFKYHENINKIESIFETVQKTKDSQILIAVDGGNPYSGPEWYIPTIGFSIFTEDQKEIDTFFKSLIEEVKKEKEYVSHPLMDILRFFIDKETGLLLRFRHTSEDKYCFQIELKKTSEERLKYFKDFFNKTSLKEKPFDIEKSPYHEWVIENDNLEYINNKLKELYNYIFNNYSLDSPKSEDEIYNFQALVRFRRKINGNKDFERKELDKILKEIQEKNKNKD